MTLPTRDAALRKLGQVFILLALFLSFRCSAERDPGSDVIAPSGESGAHGLGEGTAGGAPSPALCLVALGAPCTDDADCCSGETACREGRCSNPECAPVAGSCLSDGECCSGLCDFGVCRTRLLFSGEACQADGQCASGQCDGVCADCLAKGMICGQFVAGRCCGTCDEMTDRCTGNGLAAPARAQCSKPEHCRSGLCAASGLCSACSVAGPCSEDFECCSNDCDAGSCSPCTWTGAPAPLPDVPPDTVPDSTAVQCCDGTPPSIVGGLVQCCQPQCDGIECGDDGCMGSCGSCAVGSICAAGKCEVCTPNCSGRACGDDGCGGSCGPCSKPDTCKNGQCVACIPSCAGKVCGGDGCGGSCGECDGDLVCYERACCEPVSCSGRACGTDGCGRSCGTCAPGLLCNANYQCEANCGRGDERCTGAGAVECCAGFACGLASGNISVCCGVFGTPCKAPSGCCSNICFEGTCGEYSDTE
jgi:hypothetical protein